MVGVSLIYCNVNAVVRLDWRTFDTEEDDLYPVD